MIATIISFVGVGHTLPLIFPRYQPSLAISLLSANLNSFIFDYVGRQKIGGIHYTYFILKQVPILQPQHYEEGIKNEIIQRVLELTYTAWDLNHFAKDCGYAGPSFVWNEERRFLIRCELDATYFHLYGINRDDVDYIMENFPIVKRKDKQKYGEYRTKRVILECYDAMAESMKTDRPYQTILDQPPADPRVAHPTKESKK